MPRRSRTTSSLERATCLLASSSFVPVMCSARTPTSAGFSRRFAPFYPLIPRRLCSCFIEGAELFAAIEARAARGERDGSVPMTAWPSAERVRGSRTPRWSSRRQSRIGPTRSWARIDPGASALSIIEWRPAATIPDDGRRRLLSWLLVGHVIALVVNLAARRSPWMRQWNVHTLKPRSMRELLSLCHRAQHRPREGRRLQQRRRPFRPPLPGKDDRLDGPLPPDGSRGPDTLKADCGATVRDALDFLARNDQELYVVPNYSYVCLGTAFFVPIHGSAVDFSTVADTICRVVLYDPESDRIISAARDDPAFIEHVYNQRSRVVVLRLYLLAKPKSSYFVHHETLKNPSAGDLLARPPRSAAPRTWRSARPMPRARRSRSPGITRTPASRPRPPSNSPATRWAGCGTAWRRTR